MIIPYLIMIVTLYLTNVRIELVLNILFHYAWVINILSYFDFDSFLSKLIIIITNSFLKYSYYSYYLSY